MTQTEILFEHLVPVYHFYDSVTFFLCSLPIYEEDSEEEEEESTVVMYWIEETCW